MKFVAAILSVLTVGQVASAQMEISKSDSAVILAKTLAMTKDGSLEKELLTSLLSSQSYENRVSLTNSSCAFVGRSLIQNCQFDIGVDNLNDDDNGWSTIYRLEVKAINGEVTSLKLEGLAG